MIMTQIKNETQYMMTDGKVMTMLPDIFVFR